VKIHNTKLIKEIFKKVFNAITNLTFNCFFSIKGIKFFLYDTLIKFVV